VLTAFGIYGVVAYGVRQRTREVGIRIALGARRVGVVRMMALQGIAPVVVGLMFGAGASLYLSRFLSDLVWGMSATDPATIVAVALVLTLVAGAAAYLPARSAARSDPREALTAE
jgi:ABC-type antimicrobial peptide transport system permease subunit